LTRQKNRPILSFVKNIKLIIAAVIVILIIVVGGVLFLKYAKTPTQPQATGTQSAKTANSNSATDSISSLLSGGKNVNCSITYPNNQGTGTVFVSDKKFAGDFTMKDNSGKETATHTISDGTYIYVWSSAMQGGIKMKFADAKSTAQDTQSTQGVDINQKVDLKCSPWLPDNSKFTVPANIKFQDMSQFFQQATTTPKVGTGTQTEASPCDQIPAGPTKTACLNAMQSSSQ
jgi:hypothetical protein